MELDAPRQRLLELVAEKETDLKTVSLAIKKNHAYLQQYLRQGTPRHLPEDVRIALAEHFGVTEESFRGPKASVRSLPTPVPKGEIVEIGKEEYSLLPAFDLRLSAGPGAWLAGEGEPSHFEPFRLQWLRSMTTAAQGYLMMARVDGDSMESTLRSGDRVLIDLTRKKPNKDGIYAYRQNDELQVKRISLQPNGRITIMSDNRQYPSYPDIDPDSIEVIGRVIWLGRQV